MHPVALRDQTADDAHALLAGAQTGWTRRVPHCPGWDTAELVRHTGGILAWMAAIVTTRERVARRTLDPAPEDPTDLPSWYTSHLDQTLATLYDADPGSETWTFSTRGDRQVAWWRRRLAVEVAIHRWDVQHAVATGGGPKPEPLDGDIAAAGIGEFVTEFLPGLLAQDSIEGLGGTLSLHATDGPVGWWTDLDAPTEAIPRNAKADTTVRGTRSDLLLWLTNRGTPDVVDLSGRSDLLERWVQLRR
ncbi:MAG TPA: maleylpyruvate isomerase family mycothiol-dependent enzyme [Dermatophilaceae bacterium]